MRNARLPLVYPAEYLQIARRPSCGVRTDRATFGVTNENASPVEGHQRLQAVEEDLKGRLKLNRQRDLRQRREEQAQAFVAGHEERSSAASLSGRVSPRVWDRRSGMKRLKRGFGGSNTRQAEVGRTF